MAGSLAALVVAGGTAGAIAATSGKDDEQAVLTDAAKRLGVKTEDLRSALSQAEDNQLDAAVKAGRLTQAQADEIKQRRAQDGTVLGLGERDHGGPGFGRGGPGGLDEVAKALGITPDKLRSALRSGKSMSDVAKANGKTLDEVKAALKKAGVPDAAIEHLDGPGARGPGFGPRGGPGGLDAAIAKAIGISADKVDTQLHAGKTVSEIAKANGTTLAAVQAALKKTGDFPADLIDRLDDVGRFGNGPHPPGAPGFRHP